MKIFQIIPTLEQGGAERFVADLSNELAEKGNDVTIIQLFPMENNSFLRNVVSDKVRILYMNKHFGFDFNAWLQLFHTIKVEKPDIVNTHLDSLPYILLNIVGKTKFFHTIHNDAYKEAVGVRRLIRKLFFKLKIVTPVTISDQSEVSFENLYGMKGNLIYNGRTFTEDIKCDKNVADELRKYKKDNDTKLLVVLARICKQKRQGLIARVTKRLVNEGYNISTLLIGSIIDEETLREIENVNCKDVIYLGERQNVLSYLKIVDAFCLCSEYEGMPISLIEAMHSGAIPVCTPVGGIVDVVENKKTGFISDDISEESYYRKLKEFLDTSINMLNIIRTNVIEKSQRYDMKNCVNLYLSLYESKM